MDESLFNVRGKKHWSREGERISEVIEAIERERKSLRTVKRLRFLNTCYLTQEVVEQVPWMFLRVLVVVC